MGFVLPVRHGEGRLALSPGATLQKQQRRHHDTNGKAGNDKLAFHHYSSLWAPRSGTRTVFVSPSSRRLLPPKELVLARIFVWLPTAPHYIPDKCISNFPASLNGDSFGAHSPQSRVLCAFKLLRDSGGLFRFWEPCSAPKRYSKTSANSERVKGQLTFPAFAMTHDPGEPISDGSLVVFA